MTPDIDNHADAVGAALDSPRVQSAVERLVMLIARAWTRGAHDERQRIALEKAREDCAREDEEDARRQAADDELRRLEWHRAMNGGGH